MRTKTVKRHYCDHCRKGSFQRPTMERHEAACFRNPNRKCPVCLDAPEHKPDWDSKGDTVAAVGQECPACLMALVVLANRNAGTPDEDGPVGWIQYPRFREELREFQDEIELNRISKLRSQCFVCVMDPKPEPITLKSETVHVDIGPVQTIENFSGPTS